MSDLAWMRPKLAELCGLTVHKNEVDFLLVQKADEPLSSYFLFQPDVDVAQAVRCLEALKFDCGVLRRTQIVGAGPFWDCWIQAFIEPEGHPTCRAHLTAPGAICLAIAAALGWEAPTP